MILQVRPDGRLVDHDIDTMLLQMLRRTDPGQHEHLRRIESACAKDHAAFGRDGAAALAGRIGHAGHAAVRDLQLLHRYPDPDVEVLRSPLGFDIGARGGPALTIFLGDLVEAEAFLLCAVEIAVARQLQLRSGFDKGEAARVRPFLVAHPQRAVIAMEFVFAAHIVFGLFEIGQHVVIGPAGTAEAFPLVVIEGIAADVDHRVDGR